jgi:hypothetical protein
VPPSRRSAPTRPARRGRGGTGCPRCPGAGPGGGAAPAGQDGACATAGQVGSAVAQAATAARAAPKSGPTPSLPERGGRRWPARRTPFRRVPKPGSATHRACGEVRLTRIIHTPCSKAAAQGHPARLSRNSSLDRRRRHTAPLPPTWGRPSNGLSNGSTRRMGNRN